MTFTFHSFLSAVIGVLLLTSEIVGQSVVDSVLARFLSTDPRTFALDLERRRPAAVSQDLKARILRSLPSEGEDTKLKKSARRKLASLEQVLCVHQRQSVYEIKVISVPHAFVGLHARVVVLISDTALNFLDGEELQALVAHEIGHEYVWAEYETARHLKDYRRLQELELYCDGVVILTLGKAGVNPSRLLSGLKKIGQFNRQRFGRAVDEDYYISLIEREKFAQAVMAWAQE
jgi:predicted Zn-dependent protease